MPDNLSGRAAELAHLNDLIHTSLSLAVVVYDDLPPIVRAMIPGVAPKLVAEFLSCFHVLAR